MQFRAALKAAEELEPISSRLARIEFDTTRQVRDLFSPRLPTSLNNLAKTLQVQGRYSATESLFKQALAILQSSLPESGRNAIGTVTNLAGLYREQNNYVEAETLLRWALKNSDSELQALCLASVAEIYAEQGRHDEAAPMFKWALASWEKALGSEHPDLIPILTNLTALCEARCCHKEAQEFADRARAINAGTFGSAGPVREVPSPNVRGLFDVRGRYIESEPLAEQVLLIKQKSLGRSHPDVADALENVAMSLLVQSRHWGIWTWDKGWQLRRRGRSLAKRAITIRRRMHSSEHGDLAGSLETLAKFYDDDDYSTRPGRLRRQAVSIRESELGPEHPEVARALYNLAKYRWGGIILSLNEPTQLEGFSLQRRALAIQDKTLGPDNLDVADTLQALAELYSSTFDENGRQMYSEAEPLHQRALAIRERLLWPEHPDVASSLWDLAQVYDEQDKYAEAEAVYRRLLAVKEKVLGAGFPKTKHVLSSLWEVVREQGKHAEAESLEKQTKLVRETEIALNLEHKADLRCVLGQYERAEPLLNRVLKIRENALGLRHEDVARTLTRLAKLHRGQGRHADAKRLEARAREIHTELST